ncbi:MAG: MarR family transcriptional regulator, partial [Candidatus Altiarchaeota archaeon]
SFHVLVVEHPLEPSLYLLAIEFFAIGGLSNFLLRKKISEVQFEKILDILPKDERDILRVIYLSRTITQKDLVEKAGVYKMKVSRVIQKFEQKGVIEKKPYGYTNIIISKI